MAAPNRPTPPPSRGFLNDLFPVNPLDVLGGLYGEGTKAIGDFAGSVAAQPFPGIAPNVGLPNADMLGRDVTAMLDSPMHGSVPHPVAAEHILAAAPVVAATAKLAPDAETVASTLAKRAEPAVATPPIVAYHGSPYSFDRFDSSKIGTGEGAQAYGHGLYFASNEDVAKGYRNSLAQGYEGADGSPLPQDIQNALEYVGPQYKSDIKGGLDDAINRMKKQSDFYQSQYDKNGLSYDLDAKALYDRAHEKLSSIDPASIKPAGSVYQVDINADPNSFLNWDKPFVGQPPAVQQAINKLWTDKGGVLEGREYPPFVASSSGDTGKNIHAAIATTYGGGGKDADAQAAASQALRDAGVPGIKYLDQGSRAAGDGTNNYVLFDDSMINILKKYGLAGLGTASGAAALTAGGQSSVSPVSPAEAAPAPLLDQPSQSVTQQPGFDDWWQQLQGQRFTQAG